MNPENQQPPVNNTPPQPIQPPQQTRPGGGMTLQPSDSFAQEMQQFQPQPYQPQPQPMPQQYVQQPQPVQAAQQVPASPQPEYAQPQATASQPIMFAQPTPPAQAFQPTQPAGAIGSTPGGVYERPAPKRSFFASKLFIFGGIGALLLLAGGTLAALVFTGMISLTGFKTVDYSGTGGGEYRLSYYFDHEAKDLNGSPSLVSTVSKEGKFPLVVAIGASGDSGDYRFGKDCSALHKEYEVQNKNINQTISICSVDSEAGTNTGPTVYLAEFIHNGKNHLAIITQDFSGQGGGTDEEREAALAALGLKVYDEDIKKIISSIEVK